MLKNYLKITFRNLIRHKVYSVLNIWGLAIGVACAVLILLWIQDELSVNQYHEKIDHIYQAYLEVVQDGGNSLQFTVSPAVAPMLKNENPEIIEAVRVGGLDEVVFKTNGRIILEASGVAADPSIFQIFTYSFIDGDYRTALREPHSMVITESMAHKYFGTKDVLGQIIRVDNNYDFKITGIIKNLPVNSYQRFDFIVPFQFLKELGNDIEGTPFFPCMYLTYVLLQDNVSHEELSEKIGKRIFEKGETMSFSICLLPFKNAYIRDTDGDVKIMVLCCLALMILAIACINYTNLATARSAIREKEIGVRKASGASRIQIAGQFLTESIVLTTVAALLALVLINYFLPVFNQLTGKEIVLQLFNPVLLLGMISLILIAGISAGIYPSLYLSRFHPVGILRQRSLKSGKSPLRKILVVSQFTFSIIFIVSTLVISRQISYMRHFDLGIHKENIIYTFLDGEIKEKYELVKNELLKNPNIASVTASTEIPIAITVGSYFPWGKDDNVGRRMCETSVSYDYMETFNLQMAAGRFYSKEFASDQYESIVVNETALRIIGMKSESALGKPFFFNGHYRTLIGVVKDFQHNKMLTRPPEPLTFWLKPTGNPLLFVKINPEVKDIHAISRTVQQIKTTCDQFSPERPLVYRLLDDFTFERDRIIQSAGQIVLYSTVVAIFISCLGLFGLSMFISEQRTKEIGIRKTMGATVTQIAILLSKEFVKWVIIAALIACPLAYAGTKQWLQMFAYRIELSWWIFVTAGGLALMIALFTVSFHAIKAALANPVESLRYE